MSKILYGLTGLFLAAVASPLLTASSAPFVVTTADSLRVIGMAASHYATDNNGAVVLTQQSAGAMDKPWSVLLTPYLMTPGQSQVAFFDPARAAITTPTANVGASVLPWYSLTSLSINDAGYTGRVPTLGNTCAGRRVGYNYGARNLNTMTDPASRVAFAPTLYPGTPYGWTYFRGVDASLFKPGVLAGVFSWNNLVYDTRNLYPGGLVPVVHADGSAGTLNPLVDFKDASKTSVADHCAWLGGVGGKTWGQFWTLN